MEVEIPYGKTFKKINIKEKNFSGFVKAKNISPVKNLKKSIENAIDNPIESKLISDIVNKKDKVVIVINDITRPTPTEEMVEVLAERLNKAGIKDTNIKLVVATGTHRANTAKELKQMVGEINYNRFKIINHDCLDNKNIRYIGDTKKMPLYLNKNVVEADIVITTGVIVPHHTAGFSGGRKSIVPGVSGMETLRLHHSLPIRPFGASMGDMKTNSFHIEAVKGAKMLGVDFIVNVVQNENKETIEVVAGDLEAAHEKGVQISRKISEVEVDEAPDIVITSPGGYPRDINLYQSQKAVSPAEKIVKENGIIILVTEVSDGLEKSKFPTWLKVAENTHEVIKRFKEEGFSPGTNKAFMYARALNKCKIVVVTNNISKKDLNEMFMEKADTIEEALNYAYTLLGFNSKVLIIPRGNSVIPIKNWEKK